MTDRELMQQALDALFTCGEDWLYDGKDEFAVDTYDHKLVAQAIKALRERLAQHSEMDDAIAAGDGTLHGAIDYWQKKAQREWQGLTDEEIDRTDALGIYAKPLIEFARAIEAKLKEKNG